MTDLNLNPKTAQLIYVCEECEQEFDLEWLLTLPRNEETGYFKCKCAGEGDDEILTHSVFSLKQIK